MKKLLLLLGILFAIETNGQMVVINEYMANNNKTLQDQDGDFSDWIELYNTSNTTINLLGYSLSDDNNNLNKWTFPNVSILPQSYLLIFASNKNKLDTSELHTNFKISSSGEKLFLSNNLGVVIDQSSSVQLPTDASHGRVPDGSLNWIIINTSTPNTTNNYSNQLTFSNQEGFYAAPFSLSINSLSVDTIFYTLNGDTPSEKSNVYTGPLSIQDKNSEPNVVSIFPTTPPQNLISYKAWAPPLSIINKATTLRCVSYRNGVRTSKVYTKTFFVDSTAKNKFTLPVISLVTPAENLFNADSGIYVPGALYNLNDPEWTGNYFMRGEGWERNIHIEYFDTKGDLGFSQDAGIRIHGGKTRQAAQKTLKFYARNEYGEKYFNYKLLPNRPVNKYKRFILRTAMGAWQGQTIIKDVVAHNIASSLNIDYQEFQPVIVFINGEYWGIHTIRDRIDERYIEYTHNIDKDSVEFRNWGNPNYENLLEFIRQNNLENNSNYDYVTTQIDIDSYIDYTITELFFANFDWPGNNMNAWKKTSNGKWRWLLYDLDAGLGRVTRDMLTHSTANDTAIIGPNYPASTFLFRNLLKNQGFQSQFISRYADILHLDFDTETMTDKLQMIKDLYAPEIEQHIERWNFPNSYDKWEDDIDSNLIPFLKKRPCQVRYNIMSFFQLEHFNFNCGQSASGSNHLSLAPNPNNGNFFLLNNASDITDATVTITNINGQILDKETHVNILKNRVKHFDLTHLPPNIYMLHILSNNVSDKKKF